jgi:drug/metabolite transporter (DMT)-like permease
MSALFLAVTAALFAALGDVLQRRATRSEPDELAGSWRLLRNLARHPAWLLGSLSSLTGLGTHVLALSLGEITVVQPLLVLELPFAVLLATLLSASRLAGRDWSAITMMALGLAVFVFCLAPRGGDAGAVGAGTWSVGLGVLLVVMGVLTLAGTHTTAERRAGLLGAAAGTGYGTTAVLVSAVGVAADRGAAAVFAAWQLYAAVAVGVASFVLLQNALAAGKIMATTPGLTLANPLVAVLCGVLLFGEAPRGGAWLLGAGLGAALLVAGTVHLARSPTLAAPRPAARPATEELAQGLSALRTKGSSTTAATTPPTIGPTR